MKRRGAASKQTNGMTIMTNIQAIKVLSSAELDAIVGGTMPKAMQALEINRVEHEGLPKALVALIIHEIMGSGGYTATISASKSFQ
jgi:hypothetical protein